MSFRSHRLVAALALALAGCTTAAPSQQASLINKEARVEVAYAALSTAYLQDSTTWPPATRAVVRGILLKLMTCSGPSTAPVCTGILPTARAAVDTLDADTLDKQIAQVNYLVCLGSAVVANTSADGCGSAPALQP